MKTELLRALSMCETDIDGTLRRFAGDENIYEVYLNEFLNEPTMTELTKAVEDKNWNEAFVAAHALKGLAGNLGFVPLFHAIGELVLIIRANRLDEVNEYFKCVKTCYDEIIFAIKQGDSSENR